MRYSGSESGGGAVGYHARERGGTMKYSGSERGGDEGRSGENLDEGEES